MLEFTSISSPSQLSETILLDYNKCFPQDESLENHLIMILEILEKIAEEFPIFFDWGQLAGGGINLVPRGDLSRIVLGV